MTDVRIYHRQTQLNNKKYIKGYNNLWSYYIHMVFILLVIMLYTCICNIVTPLSLWDFYYREVLGTEVV